MDDNLVLTISGHDQPGTTAGITRILCMYPVVITQIQQIVLQNELVLGLTLKQESSFDISQLQNELDSFVQSRGMTLRMMFAPTETYTSKKTGSIYMQTLFSMPNSRNTPNFGDTSKRETTLIKWAQTPWTTTPNAAELFSEALVK